MKKILIIDYDQSSLASLQGILTKEGYQVVTAPDGQVGWDKYNKESPDLVLMEAMLPKVHGFELCQRITSERNSQATVFIMTGVYKDRVYRTEALRTYGAAEYFEKPLKIAELLASVETVLGKPAPRPEVPPMPEPEAVESTVAVAAAPARPVQEMKTEPAPVEHRKREKPKSDDDMFSLPADLDRLSKEIPKVKIPAPVRHDAPPEAKYQALADELLKSVVKDAAPPKAKVEPKPANGNGNGNGNGAADIDTFLKSALAGLDFEREKVKAPKPVPAAAPPVVEKPKPVPTPPPAVAAKPKPAPAPVSPASATTATTVKTGVTPVMENPVVEPAQKITLTPGDPGSDISPFFTPHKPKPAAAGTAESHDKPAPARQPASAPFATTGQPSHAPSGTGGSSATTGQPSHAPSGTGGSSATTGSKAVERPEPVKPAPATTRTPSNTPPGTSGSREAAVIASASLFDDVAERKTRKGLSPFVLVGVGVVTLAAVGFFVLKPKRPAPVDEGLRTPQTVTQTMTQTKVPVAAPVEEPPAPKVEPAPVKAKPKPQPKKEEPAGLGLEAIIPASVTPSGPAPSPSSGSLAGNDKAATGSSATTGSSAKTEEAPPQGDPARAESAADPGAVADAPVSLPPATPVKEGDLLELGAVSELPKLVKSVEPVYPPAAQRRGVGGSITVNALIDEKGNVIDTAILKGIKDDAGLSRAAENAVKKWKFQPARKNGVAVKVWKSFVIAFKAETAPAGGMD
jgi:TonB family protein